MTIFYVVFQTELICDTSREDEFYTGYRPSSWCTTKTKSWYSCVTFLVHLTGSLNSDFVMGTLILGPSECPEEQQ